ncbi:MAG: histidine kinase, partial [Acidimicrobiia bacterium]|nr:histidine kinase [Acidimicrobiia bacterium]
FAGGLWASTIFITALLPLALPVMVFNVVVPVVLAATYLDDRQHWPIALTGVAVAGVIGVLALTQDGLRMDDGVDEWIVDWVTIGFLVGYTWMFTATVRDANRTRVATLERALAANDELVGVQEELRRSRRRLVEVADAERGRIERNIHDGAQQRLVSMAVQLKLAAQLAERGTPTSTETLALLHDEATAALTELRELAQGIYPSLLAERGLVDAVGSLCRRSTIPARITGGLAASPPDHVEAALYFFCAEAIQNSQRRGNPGGEDDPSRSSHLWGGGAQPARRAGVRGLCLRVVSALVAGKSSSPSSSLDHLTPRETEVLGLIAEGLNNGAIAERLVLSDRAVAKHINNIFAKLNLGAEPAAHRRVRAVLIWLAALD